MYIFTEIHPNPLKIYIICLPSTLSALDGSANLAADGVAAAPIGLGLNSPDKRCGDDNTADDEPSSSSSDDKEKGNDVLWLLWNVLP